MSSRRYYDRDRDYEDRSRHGEYRRRGNYDGHNRGYHRRRDDGDEYDDGRRPRNYHDDRNSRQYSYDGDYKRESDDREKRDGHRQHRGDYREEGSRRLEKSVSPKRENPTRILVRCLGLNVTEDQLENAVTHVAIRHGFSMPNSVTIKQQDNSCISLEYPQVNQSIYGSLERVGVVQFPSSSASTKFMASMKTRKIRINLDEYFLEFDNIVTASPKPKTESTKPTIEDLKEAETLLKMRKMGNDWICPSCNFMNFSKRSACYNCAKTKPSDEVLESKNLIVDSIAYSQAQIKQSMLSDVSNWLIVRNISGEADVAQLVIEFCNTVSGSVEHLQRCFYVLDKPGNKRGFMFLQFGGKDPVEQFLNARGSVKFAVFKFTDGYHGIDTVRSLEKQVAENLTKRVDAKSSPLNIQYDTDTHVAALITTEAAKHHSGLKRHSIKLRIISLDQFQQMATNATAANAASGGLGLGDAASATSPAHFMDIWTCKAIVIPGGKPHMDTFVYDVNSDYFFNQSLNLYFDAASGYYMSLWGSLYIWDDASKSLKLSTDNNVPVSEGKRVEETKPVGGLAGILESAKRVAQVSQQTAQHMSRIKNSDPAVTSAFDVAKTFDCHAESDEESDMEVQESENRAQSPPLVKSVEDIKVRPLVICFVCCRGFESPESLLRHEQFSKYHKAIEAHIFK